VGLLSAEEQFEATGFMRDGYTIAPAQDLAALERIRSFVVDQTTAFLDDDAPHDVQLYLDSIAERIAPNRLNELRLTIIDAIGRAAWFRRDYFSCARRLLENLVGNELAMQRNVGFSIQLPGDESSLLPPHSDVWSEDSPFEVVLWIPLVNCLRTKSMFLLPPEADARWRNRMHDFADAKELFEAIEQDLIWLNIPYGNVLVFTHTLMHGNRVNVESTTRWSFNVRFKGLFTPYADKQLGEFFLPITLRPVTEIGIKYRLPAGFDK
jgi:sporadic carbohydrate cluster 2OG-Fe(II) oxygenase